jgi:hypothetical protein
MKTILTLLMAGLILSPISCSTGVNAKAKAGVHGKSHHRSSSTKVKTNVGLGVNL